MARRSRNRKRSVRSSYRQPNRSLIYAELSHIRSTNLRPRAPLPVARLQTRRSLQTRPLSPVRQRQSTMSFRTVPRRALFGGFAVPHGPSLSRRQRRQAQKLRAHVRGIHIPSICKMVDKGRKTGSGGSTGLRSLRSQRERRKLFRRLASMC